MQAAFSLIRPKRQHSVISVIVHSFIHSDYFYSTSSSPLLLLGTPDTAQIDTVSGFHTEALLATASEVLAQGPYVTARARFEPTTLQKIGDESSNEPPRPINHR